MKRFKILVLGLFMFVGVGAFGQEVIPEVADTSIVISVGGKDITINGIEKNTDVEALGTIFSEISGQLETVIKDKNFPPKDPQGWVLLILGLGGIFNKVLVSGTKAFDILKGMFSNIDTRSIVWGSGMLLSFVYQLYTVSWQFFDVDFEKWAATAFAFSAISMIVHELWTKIKGLISNSSATA